MDERRIVKRGRTLLGGKLVFNTGRSVIDCVVRNMSNDGACVEVENPAGLEGDVHLLIAGESVPRPCRIAWKTLKRLGLAFAEPQTRADAEPTEPETRPELVRGQMLTLRAALDEVQFGVVLLDDDLRAQFINHTFRKMWRLPDAKADSRPAFVALMYHGCSTRAYAVTPENLDAYVAERVARVRAGDRTPLDVRLSSGEVIRTQCAVLPNGGRMLSYTYVTDIVKHSDELEILRAGLDNVDQGIILLDDQLNAQFMNRAVRRLWKVSDEQADSKPPYAILVGDARRTGTYGVPPEELEAYIARRLAFVRSGDPAPHDLRTSDGRHIRSQCTVLPTGGRMLTYTDITDLIRNSEQLEHLATIDSMTGVFNRRHFLAVAETEWSRFQRYNRPLTLLMVDIDHFKSVNDRFGHATGDHALCRVADACREGNRETDVVGRIGGEEFAILLPETDLEQASIVAERIRGTVATQPMRAPTCEFRLTVSIGMAAATLSMSGTGALMNAADQALYRAKAEGRDRVVPYRERWVVSQRAAE
jgi:diguanylate cyclase (GGDEF)-like protein